ncbi:MAG: hypothetical protein LBL76_06655 [Treponema sp.]|nr:hypothetical protein [Treponema sp.]
MNHEQSPMNYFPFRGDPCPRPPKSHLFYPLALLLLLFLGFAFSSCELYRYGNLGGADNTVIYKPQDDVFEETLDFLDGVWYSHYPGMGRLDGYRIGRWQDFDTLITKTGKAALFPGLSPPYTTYTGDPITEKDYFVFYDDSVFGQSDDGEGGQGWDELVTRYIGIVRAINVFNGDRDRGAIIIEYLSACAPRWDEDIKYGQRPFFGIYYRTLNPNVVQMANAVDLAALFAGKKYYTETRTLQESIELNNVEHEAEFISWGVVIPQDREPDTQK